MTKEELQRYVLMGRTRSVCVSIELLPDASGYVRWVWVRRNFVVEIEFMPYGIEDEPYFSYRGIFGDIDSLIYNIEIFLGRSISEWDNHNRTPCYPSRPQDMDLNAGHEAMRLLVDAKQVPLPGGVEFSLIFPSAELLSVIPLVSPER